MTVEITKKRKTKKTVLAADRKEEKREEGAK